MAEAWRLYYEAGYDISITKFITNELIVFSVESFVRIIEYYLTYNVMDFVADLEEDFEHWFENYYRDICGELYRTLEADYDYLMSIEAIVSLLTRKGLITQQEILDELKAIRVRDEQEQN